MMKTTLASLSLCLALLTATGFRFDRKGGSSTGSTKEKRVQYAAWDDVNVIAHGLLQLGQGLKEHVDKTKVQMRDIATKMKIFNHTVTELGKESQRLRAEGEALKAHSLGLEDREGQLLNVTAELREKAEEMQHERRTMSERMSQLEERVDSVLQGDAAMRDVTAGNSALKSINDSHNIQFMLEAQNKRIDDLMGRIRLQQEKLDKQNVRIRALQTQIQQTRLGSAQRGGTSDGFAPSAEAEQRDSPLDLASDCHELFLRGESNSGVYTIQPGHSEPFQVFCEMTADGGWTVIQRRQDGSVDFDQLWQEYEKGFGTLNGEFWLGLEKMHSITKEGGFVLQVKLSDWASDLASVTLPFQLGGEETNYSLRIQPTGTFSTLEGAIGADALDGLPFSTRDNDNDRKADSNCAKHLSGGWWFSNCGQANLNGRYFLSPPPKQRHQRKQGIFWKTWRGRYYPLKSSKMMIAPAAIQRKP